MKSVTSGLLTIGLVATIAVVGSIGGRILWESVTAEDAPKAEPPPLEALNDEASRAKFQDEVLGFFVGPPAAQVPDKFVTYEEFCGSKPTEQVEWDRAGELDIALTLPEPFQLIPDSLNTGVIACGDAVYAARWEYIAPQPSGYTGSLVIARSTFKYAEFNASAERVEAGEIGGIPAILIEPLSANGIGSSAGVIFPGDTVATVISSTGVPDVDLLKVAKIVAAEIKKGS
jgi:hypothetical protein